MNDVRGQKEQLKKLETVMCQRVIQAISSRKNFSYPVLVCTRDALMVALKKDYETFNRDALLFTRHHKKSLTQTIRNMVLARPSICDLMKTRISEEQKKDGVTLPRIQAVKDGLQARLCGYDTATIILINAVLTIDNIQGTQWAELRQKISGNNDILLATWEHYTNERLLINAHEDDRPLDFGFPL